MNNSKVILITILIILLALVGMILFLNNGYNWYLTLGNSDNPYDLELFYDLIEDSNEEIELIDLTEKYDLSLKDFDDSENLNLISLDYSLSIDSTEIYHLLEFVKRGNKAFFINQFPPSFLLSTLALGNDSMSGVYRELFPKVNQNNVYESTESPVYKPYDSTEAVTPSFREMFYDRFSVNVLETLDSVHLTMNDDVSASIYYRSNNSEQDFFRYSYYNVEQFNGSNYEIIGKMDTLVNFVKLKYFEGFIYFHTTPMAFTNYHLARPQIYDYNAEVLKEFNNGNVLIDRIWHQSGGNSGPSSQNPYLPESPISFILSIPSLKWAWYLLIIGVLVFLIFRTKRNQRIIPVIPALKNNSLEFSNTVGRLYFKEKNNKRIAQELCFYFLNHIRKRYHINTKIFDEESKSKFLKIFPKEKRKINILVHMNQKSFNSESFIRDEELHELFQITRYFILKS